MSSLLSLLARLRPLGPVLAAHWRAVSVVLLALVAALALRGCAVERSRADGAEAQATAANARLKAEFEGALTAVRGLSAELAKRIDRSRAEPVAVFVASSPRQIVPLPAAPEQAQPPPAAEAGSPCVLSVGDGYEFHLSGVELKRADGGHLVLADVALDADNGLHLSAVVEAPVTLPPVDEPIVSVEVQRARWALRGGLVNPVSPSGGYLGGGLRVLGPAWAEAEARVEGSAATVSLGVRWEF